MPETDGEALIFSTSKTGLRFHESKGHFNKDEKVRFPNGPYHYGPSENYQYVEQAKDYLRLVLPDDEPIGSVVNIDINRNATYQKIIGFGGALTGAVSFNLKQLTTDKLRWYVYRSYYSKSVGNGYSLMRIPIGGCDFDLEPWAYNEEPEHDPYLSNFKKLDPRDLEKVEQINQLRKVTKNHDIKFFGAAWSPPKWMKTNGDWHGFSALREEYYQTWADYHVRYLELMKEKNVSFWAVSTGNEPLNGVLLSQFIQFMSLGWVPKNQGRWVGENLGPAIRSSKTISDVKIMTGDDQRYTIPFWYEQMYNESPDVSKYIDGLAIHWYADRYRSADTLDESAQKYPDKFLISTEACSGDKPWELHKPVLGYWGRCEDYIVDIIQDLNHHIAAWVDWNLMLDLGGGPNYASNFVDSPIVANETEIFKQPTFYAMGHFSRFIIPGSVRVFGKSSHKFVKSTAFLRPDGYMAVVLYNA